MSHGVADHAEASHRAIVAIGQIVQKQAYIMAFSDTFYLLGVALIVALVAALLLKKPGNLTEAAAHSLDDPSPFATAEENDHETPHEPYQAAPDTMKALLRARRPRCRPCGLEQSLIELVKTRASQINGCAYLHQHAHPEARKHGETEAAAVSARRVARIAALHRSRTRGAGVDRSR